MVLAQWLDDTEPDRARESLRNAMAAAERTGDPRLRARSWLRWLRFISMFDHDIDGARQWLPLVSQLIERTGDVTLECSMWRLQGILAFEGGDYGAAKQAFETSLGRRREQAGVNPLHRAYDLYYLAQAVHAAGDDASAFEHVESALEIMRTTVGPGHPTVFDFVSLRGKLLHALGDHDEAVMELSRAVSHLRDTVGPDSSHLASILLNLADALAAAGDRVAAEATAEQGRNILERNLGRDHKYTQTARLRHGRSLMGLERFAEARDLFAEFVARVDEPTEQVIGRFNLGTAAFSLGLYRDAIEVLEAAREGIDVLPEPRRHELARLIGAVLGSALAAAGDDDPAHAALGLVLEDWEPEDDEGRRWFCTAAVARARAAFVLHRPVEDDHCLTSCRGWQADSRDPRLIAATEELAGWTAG
jgi:tetratricopeptide (TPR) repeat protein